MMQSKCLRLPTVAPKCVSSRQIHVDLGVPLFVDHIRALTGSFDSNLADVGNRGLTPSLTLKPMFGRGQQASPVHCLTMAKSTK